MVGPRRGLVWWRLHRSGQSLARLWLDPWRILPRRRPRWPACSNRICQVAIGNEFEDLEGSILILNRGQYEGGIVLPLQLVRCSNHKTLLRYEEGNVGFIEQATNRSAQAWRNHRETVADERRPFILLPSIPSRSIRSRCR